MSNPDELPPVEVENDGEKEPSTKPEDLGYLRPFENEMVTIFHKSQDSFEKQLSFISAGALALSIGFVKDIVAPLSEAQWKFLLAIGWVLLVATLVVNLWSHVIATRNANQTIKELRKNKYKRKKIIRRNENVQTLNKWSAGLMIAGILTIVVFIIKNLLR